MEYLAIEATAGNKRILVIGLTEEELEPGRPDDPSAYHHLHLAEFYPDADELKHEHILLTTAPYHLVEPDLKKIVEEMLQLDLQERSFRVLALLPAISSKIRDNPDEGYTFSQTHPLPDIVVVIGGPDEFNRFVDSHLRFD